MKKMHFPQDQGSGVKLETSTDWRRVDKLQDHPDETHTRADDQPPESALGKIEENDQNMNFL